MENHDIISLVNDKRFLYIIIHLSTNEKIYVHPDKLDFVNIKNGIISISTEDFFTQFNISQIESIFGKKKKNKYYENNFTLLKDFIDLEMQDDKNKLMSIFYYDRLYIIELNDVLSVEEHEEMKNIVRIKTKYEIHYFNDEKIQNISFHYKKGGTIESIKTCLHRNRKQNNSKRNTG